MEFKDYWLACKAGWRVILGALIVALVAGAALTWIATPQYESSTRLFVAAQVDSKDVRELSERNAIAQARVASYVAVGTGSSLARRVSEEVGSDVGDVQVSVVPGTVVMEIVVTDSNPERARDIAAAYAELLPQTIEDLEQVDGSMEAPVRASVIDEASLPTSPVSPSVVRNLMFGFLLGLSVGIGLAVLRYAVKLENAGDVRGRGAA